MLYQNIQALTDFSHGNPPPVPVTISGDVRRRPRRPQPPEKPYTFTDKVKYQVSKEAADYFVRVGWAENYDGDEPCHRVDGIIIDRNTVIGGTGEKVFK